MVSATFHHPPEGTEPMTKPVKKKTPVEVKVPSELAKTVRASYDSAGHDPDLQRHWVWANGASANAAADHEQRSIMVRRSRYELIENNSIGRGIIETLVNDCIGTGPRLQFLNPDLLGVGDDPEARKTAKQDWQAIAGQVELAWAEWCKAINLTGKLRVMRRARTVDGESFAILSTNPGIKNPVQLDLTVVECDRVANPTGSKPETQQYIDGVTLDPFGNVVSYDILDNHPGDLVWGADLMSYRTFMSANVIHWFREDRPEQRRGVPECQTALPLFAIKRRFTLATVLAAENAANHAMVLSMGEGAFDHMAPDPDASPWMTLNLQRNMATVVPNGTLQQIKPEHPSTTYPAFVKELINEMARCLNMPYNIAAANSSGYNYASGRMDHQVYDRSIKIDQSWCADVVVNRVFAEWLWEAALAGILPAAIVQAVMDWREGASAFPFRTVWTWDRRPHVDPTKEAQGQLIRLKNGTTSRRHELHEAGLDMDEVDTAAAEGYGLDLETYRKSLAVSLLGAVQSQPDTPEVTAEDTDEEEQTESEGSEDDAEEPTSEED